jgi:hypothetical protein
MIYNLARRWKRMSQFQRFRRAFPSIRNPERRWDEFLVIQKSAVSCGRKIPEQTGHRLEWEPVKEIAQTCGLKVTVRHRGYLG